MSPDELERQINERCPCFAKPLLECDCQFDEEPPKPKRLLKEAYVPPKNFEPITKVNKPQSFA